MKKAKAKKGSGTKRGGNPPPSGRFKPGKSGNVKGRPRGRKNLATLFKEASGQTFEATINGKKRRISTTQSAIYQLATAAAQGDPRAIVNYLNYLDEFERRAEAAKPQPFPFTETDQELIKSIYDRMQQCKPFTDELP